MASLPSQAARRRSDAQSTTPEQLPSRPRLSSTLGAATPYVSSFVMNSPQPSPSSPSTQSQPTQPTPQSESQDVYTCWICQQESTDDNPDTSIWRRPCPCSLTAHDDCLLEWIASQEAPRLGEMATPRESCVLSAKQKSRLSGLEILSSRWLITFNWPPRG